MQPDWIFERHPEAERLMKKQGIKGMRLWKFVHLWVHYVVMQDGKRFTASYQLNPALTGGNPKTWHISDGAMPTIASPDQPKLMPVYADLSDAVEACKRTHTILQQKLGLI